MKENIKKLEEQRNEAQAQLKALVDGAVNEKRAFTEEETQRFDELEKQVKQLSATINAAKSQTVAETKKPDEQPGEEGETEEQKKAREAAEERAFDNHIRGIVETRADVNMAQGDNGAIVPTSIAKKIIEAVYDISPLLKLADRYNVAGNLVIPKYDEKTQSITVAYADEFTELTSSAGKFASVELKDFLAGALTKVSRSLIKKTTFNLTSFVVRKMAEAIALWLEGQCLYGAKDKITGMDAGVTQIVYTAEANAITGDELIDLQEEVPDIFQKDAIFIMGRKTRAAIRKLKDKDGNYLLNRDMSAKWGYTLLGKDVYTSESMKAMAEGNTAVFYGDMSGLALKVSEDVEIQVLREKYATQHAVGVVGYVAADAKVAHEQKISKLVMGGGADASDAGGADASDAGE